MALLRLFGSSPADYKLSVSVSKDESNVSFTLSVHLDWCFNWCLVTIVGRWTQHQRMRCYRDKSSGARLTPYLGSACYKTLMPLRTQVCAGVFTEVIEGSRPRRGVGVGGSQAGAVHQYLVGNTICKLRKGSGSWRFIMTAKIHGMNMVKYPDKVTLNLHCRLTRSLCAAGRLIRKP